MPTWNDILSEIGVAGSTYDVIRRQYLKKLFDLTQRNTIVYYSAWLQKPNSLSVSIDETDKNGFMAAIHHLDRKKGLDLILHTPGGDIAATESLVYYLHEMFGPDIRVIVPQIAMSAGTMIALAAAEIVMGKHSSLGPIDPQLGGVSAHALVEEFQRAFEEMKKDQTRAFVWQPILQKYPPTLIGDCEKAIKWAEELTIDWLSKGMFADLPDAQAQAIKIVKELGDHGITKAHNRRISISRAKSLSLKIVDLESNQDLQEAVMSVHHICMLSLERTPACKIIENHNGIAFVVSNPVIQLQSMP